jgi:alpha-L-fucosidase
VVRAFAFLALVLWEKMAIGSNSSKKNAFYLEFSYFCSIFAKLIRTTNKNAMKLSYETFFLSALLMICMQAKGQFSMQSQTYQYADGAPAPVYPVPSERQMAWQETEFYAFFHYGMNTFTNQEWGYGDEAETTYAPQTMPNCLQWIQAVKAAGMKGGIAVVKHHDGFCLWPTSTTTHCVTNSGGVGPKVDIPKLFGAACKQEGMKYGFYVSPWDRNSAYYGMPKYVSDVFTKQVNELCAYGNEQFEMWFDGANGGDGYYGGAKTTREIDASTYYDKPNLVDTIHKLQPMCVVWSAGEARWTGNERGVGEVTTWANVTENGWQWNPAEADAKLTDKGWFWHSGETPKSAETLFQMYLETVGRNNTLILNCPPNTSGVIPDASVSALKTMGTLITSRLGTDLARTATATASNERGAKFSASMVNDGDKNTYWATNDNTVDGATLTLTWPTVQTVRYVCLQEFIRLGQRVKGFTLETSADGQTFTKRADGQCTTIGYKRIVPLNGSTSSYGSGFQVKAIRITITSSKACPTLQTVSVY